MVELPDDLVEAASGIDIVPEMLARIPGAVELVNQQRQEWIEDGQIGEDGPINEALGALTVVAEWVDNGHIAARVRAEALREAAEKIAPNQVRPSNVIIVGARMTDDVLDMVRTVEDALVAAARAEAVAESDQRLSDLYRENRGLTKECRELAEEVITALSSEQHHRRMVAGLPFCVCGLSLGGGDATGSLITHLLTLPAEAVAGERQRIAQRLEAVLNTSDLFAADAAYVEAAWQLRSELLSTFAAGSVPVATPPRVEVASIPLDELPDWTELAEAAGATLQNHEIGCSGEYETVLHWPDGRRAGNRDRLAIISEDAEMEQFAKAAVSPVATGLQPGRVGFGTDAFEVGGSLPGQPVTFCEGDVQPTTCEHGRTVAHYHGNDGDPGNYRYCDLGAGFRPAEQPVSESIPDHCDLDAGPVATPTEPAAAEQVLAARAERALAQRVLDAHDDEFGTRHGVAYRAMVADHWRLIETFEPHRTGARAAFDRRPARKRLCLYRQRSVPTGQEAGE